MKKLAKNILYIDCTYTFGGAINSLLNLLKAIQNDGFTPILISGQHDDFIKDKISQIQYVRFRTKLPWVDNYVYKRLAAIPIFRNHFLLKTLNKLRTIYWLIFITIPESFKYYSIGKKYGVSLVHLNNIPLQHSGIISAKLLQVPCVAHSRDFQEISWTGVLFSRMIDHHIAISSLIKKNLLRLNIPESKITIVFDAIDLDEFRDDVETAYLNDEFSLSGNEQLFGIFGRIVAWKGIREFVLVAERIMRENHHAKAFIVGNHSDGDSSYYDEIRSLVRSYKLDQRIIFAGYRKDIPALMKKMDIVVHASITPEPFGMGIIEGMAMKKPVVATKAGGPIDIVVDGETGFLVNMGDIEGMTDRIIQLLDNVSLAQSMGERGRKRVEDLFSNERYARQVKEIYQKVKHNA